GIGRSEMQMDLRMALQPAVLFGLVSVQVVQYHVNFAIRVGGYDLIHEVQKLSSPAAVVVTREDLPGGDIEDREQSGCAVPLIAVAESIQGLAIGQTEPSFRTFQRLNRWLLIHAPHQTMFRP